MMRLKNLWRKGKEMIYCMLHYSFRASVLRALGSILPEGRLCNLIHEYKHVCIKKYLGNIYRDIVSIYNKESLITNQSEIPKILWIFWWQGLEKAPPIVKSCCASVERRFPEYDLRIISEANYKEYIVLPECIVRKVQAGEMQLANFSDIVRLSLLEKYGGVWLDATLFITEDFLTILTGRSFCSLRYSPEKQLKKYVPKGKWSAFFLAGCPDHIIFRFCKELLILYWTNHAYAIDYFLIDYVISLGYEEVPAIREIIDQQPKQEYEYYLLNKALNKKFTKELYHSLILCSPIYKINYKQHFKDKIKAGITLYHYLVQTHLSIK